MAHRHDPNSQSNINKLVTKHIDINWTANFETKQLEGFVDYTVEALEDHADELVLDTKDLTIKDSTTESNEKLIVRFFNCIP